MLDFRGEETVHLSILKANPFDPEKTDRYTVNPASPPPGFGLGLTTYMGDGAPLPSFVGDPLLLPLEGSPEAILETYWDALDKDNRVALALKQLKDDGSLLKVLIRNAG
jgi:hypothetical protein